MSRVKKGALELAVGVGAIDLVQAEAKKEKQASLLNGPKLGCDAERNKAEITENDRSHK